MLQSIFISISDFFRNIRFADLFDILFVSIFLYVFINWFRRSASRRLFIAAIALVIIYILSRLLGLFMTEMLLNFLAIFIALAFIIIFQSDIRRLVDIIGMWSFRRWKFKNKKGTPGITDIIAEAAVKMAERRTGAIIAIKGDEPWEQSITGGVTLNGALSLPLLYSIFSTASPGHDGALLIEENQITMFGAHLPLSKNLTEIGAGGTRHAASLGLSEQCDAIVVVVSEERGTIKIAEDGKFTTVSSAGQLKEKLDEFWQKHFTKNKESISGIWKSGKIYTGILSVILSVILWIIFAYQSESVYRTYTVPIEFRNLSPKLILEEPVPIDCRVTLAGSEQAFRILRPSELVASLDVNRLEQGQNEILFSQENFELPSGLRLYNVEPRSVRVYTASLKFVNVPVKVQTAGKLPGNLKLTGIIPEIENITLRVPEKGGFEQRTVLTEPIDLYQIHTSGKVYVRLIPPRNSRLLPDQSPEILVKVNVSRK